MNRNFAFSFIPLLASSHNYALDENWFLEKILQSAHLFEVAAINVQIKEMELLGDEQQYNDWHWEVGAEAFIDFQHARIEYDNLLNRLIVNSF